MSVRSRRGGYTRAMANLAQQTITRYLKPRSAIRAGKRAAKVAIPAAAAAAILDAANQGTSRSVGTQTSRSSTRTYGSSSYKSGGFIGRRRVSRRKEKHSKRNYQGVTLVTEVGGVLDSAVNNGSGSAQSKTNGNTVAVGHMTFPYRTVLGMACRAIVKKLFIQAGDGDLSDFELAIPLVSGEERVKLFFYTNPDNDTLQSHAFTVNGNSYNSLSLLIADYISNNFDPDYVVHSIEYMTNDAIYTQRQYTKLSLAGCTLRFHAKSTLKVQNRTVNTTGGDEESVDNVPLYGRAFEGKGAGTGAITRDKKGVTFAAREFVGDDKYGTIAKVPSEKWYQEVPRADQFLKVQKSIKAKIEPGQIKTSRLTSRLTIIFDKLIRELVTYSYGFSRNHGMHSLGHYRFMMFEKMINAVQGTATNSMKLAYETNLFMSCTATIKRNFQTAQLNDVSNYSLGEM